MSLHRPRRIFHGPIASLVRRPSFVRPLAAAVVVGVLALGAVQLAITGRDQSSPPSLAAAPLTSPVQAVNADAAQVAVVDGGTLRLRDHVVRLFGVVAPDRGVPCRNAAGGSVDCGDEATHALAGIVRAQAVACRVEGTDKQGRPFALCEVHGQDISQALVEGGWARATDAAPTLKDAESSARNGRRGLWAGNANASW